MSDYLNEQLSLNKVNSPTTIIYTTGDEKEFVEKMKEPHLYVGQQYNLGH